MIIILIYISRNAGKVKDAKPIAGSLGVIAIEEGAGYLGQETRGHFGIRRVQETGGHIEKPRVSDRLESCIL
jgi:hypothetical protein